MFVAYYAVSDMGRIYGLYRIVITVEYKWGVMVEKENVFLDFKLSPCSECCILSFGRFPVV
jgi:hypothetical protein